uniref:Uncharacterized protein n=1 Tax=Triticum urartu TaxID=4572 RepID=A0A8R7PV44_TRIUA
MARTQKKKQNEKKTLIGIHRVLLLGVLTLQVLDMHFHRVRVVTLRQPPRQRPLPVQHPHQRRAEPTRRRRAPTCSTLLLQALLLLHPGWRGRRRWRLHQGTADRARRAGREPRVDAGDVEHVRAGRQHAHRLALLHGAEADGALACAAARLARLLVRRGRQRRDGRRVQPDLGRLGGRRAGLQRGRVGLRLPAVPAADAADVEVQEQGEAEHGDEGGDGHGDEPHVVCRPRLRAPAAAAEPGGTGVARLPGHGHRHRHARSRRAPCRWLVGGVA